MHRLQVSRESHHDGLIKFGYYGIGTLGSEGEPELLQVVDDVCLIPFQVSTVKYCSVFSSVGIREFSIKLTEKRTDIL